MLTLNIFPQGETLYHIIVKYQYLGAVQRKYDEKFIELFKKLKNIETDFEVPAEWEFSVQFKLTIMKNIAGKTPLTHCIDNKHEQMVKVFLTHFDLENFVESQEDFVEILTSRSHRHQIVKAFEDIAKATEST